MKRIIYLFIFVFANFAALAQSDYVKEMQEKAEAGDAKEQYFLAQCYEFGSNGFEQDYAKAVEWYKKSAENGYDSSANKLAKSYKSGKLGLQQDDKQYIFWLEKAAELGNNNSSYDLAKCYMEGNYGLKKDEKQGIKWAKKSADGGNHKAMFILGTYYKEKDKDEAISWLKKSADTAYKNTGRVYDDAIEELKLLGVDYDPEKSPSNQSATSKSKEIKSGQQIDIYYQSGDLCKTAQLTKKGNDYYAIIDNKECKLIPYNKTVYSAKYDKEIFYTYTLKYFDIDMMVKDQISGAPASKASSDVDTDKASNKEDSKTKSKKDSNSDKAKDVTKKIGKGVKKLKGKLNL